MKRYMVCGLLHEGRRHGDHWEWDCLRAPTVYYDGESVTEAKRVFYDLDPRTELSRVIGIPHPLGFVISMDAVFEDTDGNELCDPINIDWSQYFEEEK